ncbi:CocE/NonD family hydrolase [Nonomuraea sp. K274]|uniref:CocE/NonD family hydrolase n=1 Tax=Nonomuraea cypriaca TaxID=1187855 RepID=A0A931F4R4_9ACTN|nr:CocE/NonD family hydrolase [Nonomuraea cypriaca]MBF8192922.1 CocE/NonD family hydrolase [Nonomuraea cypriaca]
MTHFGEGEAAAPPFETPVRVFLQGAGRWIGLPDWPPPASAPTTWFLHADGALSMRPATSSGSSSYRYDPADPTPSVGGAFAAMPFRHGAQGNRRLENRADVLTFTSSILDHEVEVVGEAVADLHVRSSLPHADFFARLCDVAPNGRSTNITDGIIRLSHSAHTAIRPVRITLAGTAYRRKPGCISNGSG